MLSSGAYIAPNATVIGDVTLEEGANIWYGAVLRGDKGAIYVGSGTNIQDNCVLHADPGMPMTIGDDVTVGHGAILHSCTVGNNSLIGMGAIVLNGAKLADHCLVGAGAVVTGKTDAPAGSVLLGNPAKIVKELTPEARIEQEQGAEHYLEEARKSLG